MTVGSGISAQKSVSAFSDVSLGLELISTTGFGLELATPLSANFDLRGGFSMLPYSYSAAFGVTVNQSALDAIDLALIHRPDVVDALAQKGLPTKASEISNDVNATASLNLVNGKILLDYYPSAKYIFHITCGIYFGSSQLIKVKGRMNQATDVLNVLSDMNDTPPGFSAFPYIVDNEKGYQLTVNDIKNITGDVQISAVKPYLGLGFGQAIPKSRLSVNFEIGAFYQGAPALKSDNENMQKIIDNELSGLTATLEKFSIYPVVSFKLNIRL